MSFAAQIGSLLCQGYWPLSLDMNFKKLQLLHMSGEGEY
jgi:hypothetical protein